MNNWNEFFSYSISGAAQLLSAMGLWFAAIIPGIDHWSKRFFVRYFLVFMLCCLSGVLEKLFQFFIVPGQIFYFLLLLESLLLSLPLPMLTVFLLLCQLRVYRGFFLYHAGKPVLPRPPVPILSAAVDRDRVSQSGGNDKAPETAFPQGVSRLSHRHTADYDCADRAFVHRRLPTHRYQLRMLRTGHVQLHTVRSDRTGPPPPTGNCQTAAGNCQAATGNRPRAHQRHGAANEAAFHLQYTDEHLQSLQARPKKSPADHDGFRQLSLPISAFQR